MVGEGEEESGYGTAADCISAGMYWFSQSDLAAAEAWWRRAIELEPENQRAYECLRLLQKTSSTGFKSDSWARLPALSEVSPAQAMQDVFSDPEPADRDSPSEPAEPATGRTESIPRDSSASSPKLNLPETSVPKNPFPWSDPESELELAFSDDIPEDTSGASGLHQFLPEVDETDSISSAGEDATNDIGESLEVRARQMRAPQSETAAPLRSSKVAPAGAEGLGSREIGSPWDEGPSRTSIVTVRASGEFDAVADPTPLPELDRERFFNRGDPSSRDEIVDFLRATGDLPEESNEEELGPAPEPGMDTDSLDSIQDAVTTEPSTSLREANPRLALQLARDRYQLHDFQGVLEALYDYPSEAEGQTEVRNMMAESRANLLRMYEAKIGSLDQVPRVLVSSEEIIWLNLNHRAGFILSQVDGTVSYEDLISLSGMPRLDTVRILTELLDQNVIGL